MEWDEEVMGENVVYYIIRECIKIIVVYASTTHNIQIITSPDPTYYLLQKS